jgi:hypothetical protein
VDVASYIVFPHRHNLDGSHDSICVNCFRTVSSTQREIELEAIEKKHVCAVSDLCYLSAEGR